MQKTIPYGKVILSSRQILFQISQVFSLVWVWDSIFLKREEGYVSAYFIRFLFIIHTIRDRRTTHTWSILSDVSSEKYIQPKPQKASSVGAARKLNEDGRWPPQMDSYSNGPEGSKFHWNLIFGHMN